MKTFVKSQLLKKNVNFKKDSEINHELRRTFRLSFFRSKTKYNGPSIDIYK